MYRKHLKMARGEGEVESRQSLRSHFVERVVKLPMFHVAWDYAANTYTTIKESNRLVNFTLTNAERSVNFMADQAKPVVMKFEKQIQVVDDLACKGLGTLEEKVPLITRKPEQIIGDTRKLYTTAVYNKVEELKKYSEDKVKRITDYGLQTASTILGPNVINIMVSTVDGVLVSTEKYVDYILPPVDEDNEHHNDVRKEKDSKEILPYERAFHIASTIQRRLYRISVVRLREIRQMTGEIYNVPDYVFSFAFQNVEAASLYIQNLWESINSEESIKKMNYNKPMKQFIIIIRPIVKTLMEMYSSYEPPRVSKNSDANNSSNDIAMTPAEAKFIAKHLRRIYVLLRSAPHLLSINLFQAIPLFGVEKKKKSTESTRKHTSGNSVNHEQNHVNLHDGGADHLD